MVPSSNRARLPMTLAERIALAAVEARVTGSPVRPPLVADRYEVLELLGRGGMGEVYRARDRELGRDVALKHARPGLFGGDAVGRLADEARMLARLADPDVVAVYDVIAEHDSVLIVMELVRGCSLRSWLAQQRRSWQEILPVMIAAGRGLAAAHRAGIVHRDVKPDNIMLVSDDAAQGVRLVDFGLAYAAPPTDPSNEAAPGDSTRAVVIEGTLAYLAPELLEGSPADALSDQFAFCVTIFEALHGRRPQGETSSSRARGRRSEGSPVPARVRRAIERGLARDRDARHESMDALLAELSAALRSPARRGTAGILGAVLSAATLLGMASPRSVAAIPTEAPTITPTTTSDRSHLARVDALVDAGELTEALALAEREHARLQASGDDRGAVDAALRVGRLRVELGQHDAAQVVLRNAYFDARALRYDERARESALDLTAMSAHVLARPVEAADWLRHARALSVSESDGRLDAAEAGLLLAHGRAAPAVDRYRTALSLATDPTRAAWMHHNLGVALHEAGRDDEAVTEHMQALALLGQQHPTDHPDIAFALTNLANALRGSGRQADALMLHRRALSIREHALGSDHPDAAASLVNIAAILADEGRLDEARTHLRRALAVQERTLGPDHPDLAATLNNLGLLADDPEEAAIAYGRARAIQEATLDADDPALATVLGNLAVAYTDLGRHRCARELLQRALELRERSFGPRHLQTAYPLHNLGVVALAAGDAESALPLLERALSIRSDGGDAVLLATTQLSLARGLATVDREPARVVALASEARASLAASGRSDLVAEADALLQRSRRGGLPRGTG